MLHRQAASALTVQPALAWGTTAGLQLEDEAQDLSPHKQLARHAARPVVPQLQMLCLCLGLCVQAKGLGQAQHPGPAVLLEGTPPLTCICTCT